MQTVDSISVKTLISQEAKGVEEFVEGSAVARIGNQQEYDGAIETAKVVRAKKKDIEVKRKSIVDPINKSVKDINGLFKPLLNRLELFETGLKRICGVFVQEKEREALERQRAAQAAADKERAKLARQADRQEAKGDNAKAEVTRMISETIPTPVATAQVQKSGLYNVKRYKATVRNKAEFVRWCLVSDRLEYLEIKESLLNSEATKTVGERQWPGIEIVKSVESRMRG